MLTIGLSLSSRFKLLKSFVYCARGVHQVWHAASAKITKTTADAFAVSMHEAVSELSAPLALAPKTGKLRIARTTLPEHRFSYNDTFQHIRSELDIIYQEKNPVFDNVTHSPCSSETPVEHVVHGDATPKAAGKVKVVCGEADTPALWVSRTVVPNERPDFNDTFRHIRKGLDEFYKARNQGFNNIIGEDKEDEPAAGVSSAAKEQQPLPTAPDQHAQYPLPESRNIKPERDKHAVKNRAKMQLSKTFNDRSTSETQKLLADSWVGIPALAEH